MHLESNRRKTGGTPKVLTWAVMLSAHLLVTAALSLAFGQSRTLEARMHHLRIGDTPEWASFPKEADGEELVARFDAATGSHERTLRIRQQDVKQTWHVQLNDSAIGTLIRDEKDTILYLSVPADVIRSGENTLRIEQEGTTPDDIRVGELVLEDRPMNDVLSEATVHLEVVAGQDGKRHPARITVVNENGALQTVWADSSDQLAVRPGFVYTGNGKASFGLPAGAYTMYAGRGFEYGIDSLKVVLKPGEQVEQTLTIDREVPTEGWVSSDTHIHTYTYSGHGDASVRERALTIAGEGIELPIMTDHNVHVDIGPAAAALGVRSYFTPATGNEVTTPVGHFNIFPVAEDAAPPEHDVRDWETVSRSLRSVPGAEIVILNHARDLHSGFRPFGPKRHVAAAGVDLDGWALPANAMEVINSGALQTDIMRLYRDWFGMLNRGYRLTPVGSSDSHDVSRYVVGQARTYVRSGADDAGAIDVSEVVENFRQGKVMVSFGLLAEMTINDTYGPGDLVPSSDTVTVSIRVLGPSWTRADRVTLYVNGRELHEASITDGGAAGVKWSGTWNVAVPPHDVYLVAVAEGPGGEIPFWPIAKPYQPTSREWTPKVFGSTGAAWIDGDADGRPTSARAYAEELLASADGKLVPLVEQLAAYDEAIAVQAAALLQQQGRSLTASDVTGALRDAAPATRSGFETFMAEWKASLAAREKP